MSFGMLLDPIRRRRPRQAVLAAAAALALLFAPGSGFAQGSSPQGSSLQGSSLQGNGGEKSITRQVQQQAPIALPSLHPLVARVLPAVVNISSQLTEQAAASSEQSGGQGEDAPFDQFMKRFFNNRGLPQLHHEVMALGSGFIISPDGYIVTNNHVVGGAQKITVILQDNTRHPAKIIGRDEKTDLALLKIDAGQKLPFVEWGDSDASHVGDWVVAVGNPFGLGGTVTAGIVSAVGRNINEGPYDDFIQIDAPINRGNSGGPTFNLFGQVIGINTAIYSPSGGSVGIGFAVPSNTAKNVIEQLKKNGHVTRGYLGVAIQSITPAIARSLGMNPNDAHGALVASVNQGTPAEKAGIKQGDIIVAADGQQIKRVHDLPRLVAATPPGHKLALTIERSGKQLSLTATVAEMPSNPQVASTAGNEEATSLGLQLSALTAKMRDEYHVAKDVKGVVVTKVASDSPAAALGVRAGDVIESVDQEPARTPLETAKQLKAAAAKGNILLLLNRRGVSQFVGLSVTPGVGSGSPG